MLEVIGTLVLDPVQLLEGQIYCHLEDCDFKYKDSSGT